MDIDCRASPSPPLLPDLPSPSCTRPRGEGARERCSTSVCRSTDDPTPSRSTRGTACIGPHASPQSSGQPDARAGSKRPLEPLTRPVSMSRCAGTSAAAPRWPFATLAARSTLAIPTCPRRRRGQGPMLDQFVGRLTTDGPVRVRHHVCIGAKRQATILVTAGGQGPGRSDHRSC